MKKYTINEQNEIQECSPFGYDSIVVFAENKTEATKKILTKFRNMDNFGPPKVYLKNNALCVIHHNGDEIVARTGNKEINNKTGEQTFRSIGGGNNKEDAFESSDFNYYCNK